MVYKGQSTTTKLPPPPPNSPESLIRCVCGCSSKCSRMRAYVCPTRSRNLRDRQTGTGPSVVSHLPLSHATPRRLHLHLHTSSSTCRREGKAVKGFITRGLFCIVYLKGVAGLSFRSCGKDVQVCVTMGRVLI